MKSWLLSRRTEQPSILLMSAQLAWTRLELLGSEPVQVAEWIWKLLCSCLGSCPPVSREELFWWAAICWILQDSVTYSGERWHETWSVSLIRKLGVHKGAGRLRHTDVCFGNLKHGEFSRDDSALNFLNCCGLPQSGSRFSLARTKCLHLSPGFLYPVNICQKNPASKQQSK